MNNNNDIIYEYDDLSGLNDAKDFPQSQTPPLTPLDQPDFYQEYESLEFEEDRNIEVATYNVESLEQFKIALESRLAVSRADRDILVSMDVSMEDILPPANSYTKELSPNNYIVTLENVVGKIAKGVANLVKTIFNAIFGLVSKIASVFKAVFSFFTGKKQDANTRATNAKQNVQEVIRRAPVLKEAARAIDKAESKSDTSSDADRRRQQFLDLRNLLNKEFNDIKSLRSDVSKDLDPKAIINEMLAQKVNTLITSGLNRLNAKQPPKSPSGARYSTIEYVNEFLTDEVVKTASEKISFYPNAMGKRSPQEAGIDESRYTDDKISAYNAEMAFHNSFGREYREAGGGVVNVDNYHEYVKFIQELINIFASKESAAKAAEKLEEYVKSWKASVDKYTAEKDSDKEIGRLFRGIFTDVKADLAALKSCAYIALNTRSMNARFEYIESFIEKVNTILDVKPSTESHVSMEDAIYASIFGGKPVYKSVSMESTDSSAKLELVNSVADLAVHMGIDEDNLTAKYDAGKATPQQKKVYSLLESNPSKIDNLLNGLKVNNIDDWEDFYFDLEGSKVKVKLDMLIISKSGKIILPSTFKDDSGNTEVDNSLVIHNGNVSVVSASDIYGGGDLTLS